MEIQGKKIIWGKQKVIPPKKTQPSMSLYFHVTLLENK